MWDEGHDHAGCFSHPSTSELEGLEMTAWADSPKRDPPLHEITPVAMGSCASGHSPRHAPPVPPKRHPEQPSSHRQQRPDLSVFTVNKKKSPGRKNKPAHSRLFLYIRRQQK